MVNRLLITFTVLIFNLLFSQSLETKFKDPLLRNLLDKKFPVENLKDENHLDFKIENLFGKPTLINIWFTTCEPCIEELPYLNKLKNRLNSQINFVAITFDSEEKVEKFLLKHDFKFKHLNVSFQDLEKHGIYKYPLNFVVDGKGYVKRILGGFEETETNEVIQIFETLR